MHTRAAARRSAAAAQWVDLPQPLWEAIAAQLPTADVMSLRQAWHGASQLASQRVRSEAVDSLKSQLNDSLVMAYCVAEQTAVHGVPLMLEALGVPDLDFLSGFLEGGANALSHNFGCRFERTQLGAFLPLPGVESYRCTFELEPRHTGVIMQVMPSRWLVALPGSQQQLPAAVDVRCTRQPLRHGLGCTAHVNQQFSGLSKRHLAAHMTACGARLGP